MHLVLSPPLFLLMLFQTPATDRAVVVNLPDLLFSLYPRATLASQSATRAVPRGVMPLGLGTHLLEVSRTDERTLTIGDAAGFGHDFSLLYRPADSPMPVGTTVTTPTVTVTVEAAREGVPTRVAFRFAVPLEDPSLRWVAWDGEMLVPFTLPALGAQTVLPARPHPLLRP